LEHYGPVLVAFVIACFLLKSFDLIWSEFINQKPKLILITRFLLMPIPAFSFGASLYLFLNSRFNNS